MGLISARVYFDSCIAIYLVEEHPVFAPVIETYLVNQANTVIQVSELTEMECLVAPLRHGNQPLLRKYQKWFEAVDVLPVGRDAFQRAARLRADTPGLKTPDAIHIAIALHNNCDEFWTNDNRLASIAPAIVKNITTP